MVRLMASSASEMFSKPGPPRMAVPAVGITVNASIRTSVAFESTSERSMVRWILSGLRISYSGTFGIVTRTCP